MTRLSAASGAAPAYDRGQPPSIVHVGVGAFARAHLGVYADDLLRQGWPATIRGVSLRSRAAEDQLAPQDGLYTVVERGPDAEPLRVIGSLTSVGTGPEALIDALAAPTTRLVTLTITEKGYEGTAPSVLATGLARRCEAGGGPVVVASLDNLLGNGALLRERVLAAASAAESGWIDDHVSFPSSVVDRMVPATMPPDLAEVAAWLGLDDEAAVVAEHHRSWVIEAVDGLPPLADVRVEVVPDVTPYERRKLWLLNGPHSALAYTGLAAGCATIAEAATHPVVAAFVRRYVDEVLEVANLPASVEASTFAGEALARFANPALGHTCAQVGTDGSQKLPQRLLPVLTARRAAGLSTARGALVIAGWVAAVRAGTVDDPAADEVRHGARAIAGFDPDSLAEAAALEGRDLVALL